MYLIDTISLSCLKALILSSKKVISINAFGHLYGNKL